MLELELSLDHVYLELNLIGKYLFFQMDMSQAGAISSKSDQNEEK